MWYDELLTVLSNSFEVENHYFNPVAVDASRGSKIRVEFNVSKTPESGTLTEFSTNDWFDGYLHDDNMIFEFSDTMSLKGNLEEFQKRASREIQNWLHRQKEEALEDDPDVLQISYEDQTYDVVETINSMLEHYGLKFESIDIESDGNIYYRLMEVEDD